MNRSASDGQRRRSGRASLTVWMRYAALLALFLGADLEARGPWETWKDCRLQENDANDGDSFHVKAGGKGYIVRLYLVDAPETDAGFPERVAEQGKYFAISPAKAVELGELARKFVEEKLSRPFTVHTSKQTAMGRSNALRYYGFVETGEGDLGELLVANGLARVHGVAPGADDAEAPKSDAEKLKRLEMEARTQKVGGWGASTGRMSARLAAPGKRLDSFDAFFHPERALASESRSSLPEAIRTPPAIPAIPAATNSSPGGKVDINRATVAELVKLKGIGPVLAGRIIAARPFKNADDLRRVKGIGAKKYEKLRPYFGPTS